MKTTGLLKLALCSALALSLSACGRNGDVSKNQVKTKQVRPNLYKTDRVNDGRMRIRGIDSRNHIGGGYSDNTDQLNRWDNRRGNNMTSVHNNTRMDMSQDLADSLAKMKGVDSAYVMLTDRNAYVAVNLNESRNISTRGYNGGSDVADDMKRKISAKVKKRHPEITNVYVSANPDFVGRMKGYADQLRAGHPIRGLIIEFNRTVNRIFPSNVNDDRYRNQ